MNRSKLKYLCIAFSLCLLAASATKAFAVLPREALHNNTPFNVVGLCCTFWGPTETVFVTEPAAPVPVIISWSADYTLDLEDGLHQTLAVVGLSVNGGPCLSYGSGDLYSTALFAGQDIASRTFHELVLPSDGPPANRLHKGVNSFELCSGGQSSQDQVITIWRNSMAARLSQ